MTSVDFSVRTEDAELTSADALQRLADLEASRPWDLEGAFTLEAEDLSLRWEDTLVPLFGALLEAVVTLAETGHCTVSRTTEYGYLRLDVEGTWLRIGGDGLPPGRVEREAFLHGLFRATGSLIALLQALDLDGFDVRALREDRAAAIRALASPGWVLDGHDSLPPLGGGPPREEASGPVVRLEDGRTGWFCDGLTLALPGQGWDLASIAQRLKHGQSFVVRAPQGYGYARFDLEGDQVRISGDGMGDLRLPLQGVLASLA